MRRLRMLWRNLRWLSSYDFSYEITRAEGRYSTTEGRINEESDRIDRLWLWFLAEHPDVLERFNRAMSGSSEWPWIDYVENEAKRVGVRRDDVAELSFVNRMRARNLKLEDGR